MRVGFTGTRKGMSEAQVWQLRWLLALLRHDRNPLVPHEFHFGEHVSVRLRADAYAAGLAESYGFLLRPHRATRGNELRRDRALVAAVEVLVAAPLTDEEQRCSGTWATVRYARAACKPVVMLSRGRER